MGRVSDVPLGGYKQPTLTQQDIEAVSINPADLNRYKEFLSQSNTGIAATQREYLFAGKADYSSRKRLPEQCCRQSDGLFFSHRRL
jgi:hypothetical protein